MTETQGRTDHTEDSDQVFPTREGEPNFELVPILSTPTINPGETIKINYYFSGIGVPIGHPIDHGKLYANFSGIKSNDNVKIERGVQGFVSDDGSKYKVETGERAHQVKELPEHISNVTHGLDKSFFLSHKPDEPELSEGEIPPIHGEFDFGDHPPLIIKVPTSKDQDPGDYEIKNVFTYSQNNQIKASRENLTVHVNTWIERRAKMLKIATIIIAVIGVLLAILSFGVDGWEFFTNGAFVNYIPQ